MRGSTFSRVHAANRADPGGVSARRARTAARAASRSAAWKLISGHGSSAGRGGARFAGVGHRHVARELDVAEREVGVVRPPEHAVRAQRDAVGSGHEEVAPDLRGAAAVAQHLDVDGDRSARHRRAEDRVGGDERSSGRARCVFHRAQRGRHRDAAEGVDDAPRLGDRTEVATGTVGIGFEAGVAEQVARGTVIGFLGSGGAPVCGRRRRRGAHPYRDRSELKYRRLRSVGRHMTETLTALRPVAAVVDADRDPRGRRLPRAPAVPDRPARHVRSVPAPRRDGPDRRRAR